MVFDQRHYGIFKDMPGVRTDGRHIRVSGATLAWADPSHGSETMLRSEFTPAKPVRSARLYAAAMGIFRLWLNGQQVGNDWFAPGDSQYRETMCYLKYDVTDLLRAGRNALGAELAGGWYTGYVTFSPGNFNFFGDREALLARLAVVYEDGTRESFVTTPNGWKVWQDGPVRLGSFFQGERYDARKALPGWSEPGFDDSAWAPAVRVAPRDWVDFDIVARYDEPVRVREVLTARRQMPVHDDNTYIYDMGVNMVGVPEIDIPAGWLSEGDVVTLTYGEQVYPGLKGDKNEYVQRFGRRGRGVAGHILYESNRAALDADFYIADGPQLPREALRSHSRPHRSARMDEERAGGQDRAGAEGRAERGRRSPRTQGAHRPETPLRHGVRHHQRRDERPAGRTVLPAERGLPHDPGEPDGQDGILDARLLQDHQGGPHHRRPRRGGRHPASPPARSRLLPLPRPPECPGPVNHLESVINLLHLHA